ncbi:MAG: response regulator [Planctomycetota bacterium]|nr:MAG: response regulator [Planctomycetota bacterium]
MFSRTLRKKTGGAKILVVDDDRYVSAFMNIILSQGGYEVVTAQDGLEGIDKAEKEKPDLILLDFMMPNMDGLTTLAGLKKSKETAGIPVIMVTASDDKTNVIRAHESGASGYVVKPIDKALLLERIASILKKAAV